MANQRARLRKHNTTPTIDHSPYGDAPGVARQAAGWKRLRPGSVAYNTIPVARLTVHSDSTPGKLYREGDQRQLF